MADSAGTRGAGTYELGPASGRVLVKTGRAGLAARAGHDLTLEITDWQARVTTPGEDGGGVADATVTAFESRRVIASSTSSSGAPSAGAIEGTLTLHGVSRGIRLQVSSPEPGRYRGSATIRQSDFGITPYSGFFGALKLLDEVTVEFEVTIEGLKNGSA
jgi:hypothetical protein